MRHVGHVCCLWNQERRQLGGQQEVGKVGERMNDRDDDLQIDTVMEETDETQEDLPFLFLLSPELCLLGEEVT